MSAGQRPATARHHQTRGRAPDREALVNEAYRQELQGFLADLRRLWKETGGPTQTRIAEKLKLNKRTVSDIFNGRRAKLPEWETVLEILKMCIDPEKDLRHVGVSTDVDEYWHRRHGKIERMQPTDPPRNGFDNREDVDNRLLSNYLIYVKETYQSVKLSTLPALGNRPRRSIQDLFVEPRLLPTDTLNPAAVQATRLIGDPQLSVVLGESGSGKSSLLQYFAWRNASDALERNRSARIPFLVHLGHRELAEWSWTDDHTLFPFGFVAHLVSTAGVELTVSMINAVAARGRALFLFDGLDEIAQTEVKNIVVERLGNTRFGLSKLNKGNRMILTARPSEADTLEPLSAEQFVLGGFDAQEIKRFARNWYGSEDVEPVESDREAHRFLTSISHPQLRRLSSSPLYLTIMALLDQGDLDSTTGARSELFNQLTKHMLYRDKNRGIAGPDVPERIKRLRLEELAMLLQKTADDHHDGRSGVPATTALDALAKHIANYEEWDRGKAEHEAERFLAWCADRAGLIELRGQVCSFRHETLEHYFVATALDTGAHREPDRRAALVSLFEGVHQPRWTEPLLFLAGRLTPEEATEVVETVFGRKIEYERFHHKNLIMTIRVLGECEMVRAATRDKVLNEIWGRLKMTASAPERRLSGAGRRAYREAVLVFAALRGTVIEPDAVRDLTSILRSSLSTWARARACELLGALASPQAAAIDHLLKALEDADPTVQDNARRALVSISRFDEGIAARLGDLLTADDSTELVGIHACRALMHLHRCHAHTLRTAFLAEGANGKLRREWVRATIDGWTDPDGTWEADRQAVVDCLLEAFAAPHAHSKSSAAWIAGRVRLKDSKIHKAIKDLLVYEGEKAGKVQSAAKTALKQIADAGEDDRPGHTPVRNRTTHPLVPIPEGYRYVGEVLHYWPRPRAALVDLAHPLTLGDELIVLDRKAQEGKPMERFRQVLESMQVEGRSLREASSGMSVALVLKEPVHVGERLYADRTNTRT